MAESDEEAATRVIERATDKNFPALSVDERNAIVSICKISRQNIESVFNALQNRLTSSHLQVRARKLGKPGRDDVKKQLLTLFHSRLDFWPWRYVVC